MTHGLRIELAFLLALLGSLHLIGQTRGAEPFSPYSWRAAWIAHPSASASAYGVYEFTREFDADTIPSELWVRVSGDNRYRLRVNGVEVCEGPQSGDLQHWRYARLDIAGHLRVGGNVISARVWNYGDLRPVAMQSSGTAFVLEVEGEDVYGLGTGPVWSVAHDLRYAPFVSDSFRRSTYVAVAPGEQVDQARDMGLAAPAAFAARAVGYGQGTDGGRLLEWDGIDYSAYSREGDAGGDGHAASKLLVSGELQLVAIDGVPVGDRLVDGSVPAFSRKRYLYRSSELRNGTLEGIGAGPGGRGAKITITYAESLVDSLNQKHHRDSIVGKHIFGLRDVVALDGNARPVEFLTWRTWRYVELDVRTQAQPLAMPSALTYSRRSYFAALAAELSTPQAPELERIFATGLHTAESCLVETFMDCPYYERLQYLGDTRIQALIRLYNSDDDRPVLRAIRDFDRSRTPEGLTQSRFPSQWMQVIPPFSLFWVGMIGDYHRIRGNDELVVEVLPGIREVLDWHQERLRPDGLLTRLPWWNFVDWTDEWAWNPVLSNGGVPPEDAEGGSVLLTLQYAYALREAVDLLAQRQPDLAGRYDERRREVLEACAKTIDLTRGYYPDAQGIASFSQHTQIMAVLAGAYDDRLADGRRLMESVLSDTSLIQTTYYYRFFLIEALAKLGMADLYLSQLGPWREQLALGLTTFAEKPDPTRSDCHAWSASPSYHLLRLVGGVDIREGGRVVDFAPQLGDLRNLELVIPHPGGDIRASYIVAPSGGITAELVLPKGATGTFAWRGRTKSLGPGAQTVAIE